MQKVFSEKTSETKQGASAEDAKIKIMSVKELIDILTALEKISFWHNNIFKNSSHKPLQRGWSLVTEFRETSAIYSCIYPLVSSFKARCGTTLSTSMININVSKLVLICLFPLLKLLEQIKFWTWAEADEVRTEWAAKWSAWQKYGFAHKNRAWLFKTGCSL